MERDVAVVLSGGAVNGVLIELGFLQRLRETDLWPRIGWIYGTSAGALAGTMAALDRLDELEEFMLSLQPEQTFRPHSLWRMPLHQPYRKMLDSKVADINNVSESSFAGAITAALFLDEFVDPAIPWVHIDMMAWNPSSRPGRPEGGEAQALRALYALIAAKAASAV